MIRLVIARLMRHAFMEGYQAALENATQELNGAHAWPDYDPEPKDWLRLQEHLDKTGN